MPDPDIKVVTTTPEIVVEEEQSRFKRFTLNHPRTAKVLGIAAITGATLGALQVIRARREAAAEAATEQGDDTPFDSSEIA